jgi:hypothetical protein
LVDNRKTRFSGTAPALLQEQGVQLNDVLKGRKLKEAIMEDAAEVVRLQPDPDRPLSWFIIPASVSPNESRSPTLIERSKVPSHGAVPKYKRPFWAAFIKRIPEGRRRYIYQNGLKFDDLPNSVHPPIGGYEVTDEYLVGSDMLSEDDYRGAVNAAIERWLGASKLSSTDFLDGAPEKPTKMSARGSESARFLGPLASLPDADLKRIVIPLDIILKLAARRD